MCGGQEVLRARKVSHAYKMLVGKPERKVTWET
jgi:hypothetical protein